MKLQSILQVSFGMILSAILIVLIKQIQNVERKLDDINNNYATLSTNINSGLTNVNTSISNLMTLVTSSQNRINRLETANDRRLNLTDMANIVSMARSYETLVTTRTIDENT